MNIMKKLFEITVICQTIMLTLFIVINIETLNNIEFEYVLDEDITTTSLNFYSLISILLAVMLVGVLASFNIFGGGLNEEGTRLLLKYLGLILLIAILFIASYYFLAPIGLIGTIINMMFLLSYTLRVIDTMVNVGGSND